jgi:hypothetical protein
MRHGVALGVALVVALLAPAATQARPPTLLAVGHQSGHITANWSLPPDVRSRFIEVSTTPTVNAAGYFSPQGNITTFAAFRGTETTFRDPIARSPDTYYVHVAGEDFSCHFKTPENPNPCPGREFSEIMAVSFSSPGGGSGGGGGGGGGASDKRAPAVTLSARQLQRVRSLQVLVQLDEPGSVSATARASSGGGDAAVYRFRSDTKQVKANTRARLALKISKGKLRAIQRVLRKRKRLNTSVAVTARDRAGNASVQKLKIRIKK